MRVLVISDIHSNFVALDAVAVAVGPVDQIWNLGDTIGYGPSPNECVAFVQQHAAHSIAGNHDLASLGRIDLNDFNPDAKTANLWNGEQLTPEHRAFFDELQPAARIDERFVVAHASPLDPVWEYVLTRAQAIENFAGFDGQVCFIGHAHIPLFFRLAASGRCEGPVSPPAGRVLTLEPGVRYLINPGSIGQPRNQDPRAACLILDTDAGTVTFERVEYDIAATQRQMRAAGLPETLALRLQYGM